MMYAANRLFLKTFRGRFHEGGALRPPGREGRTLLFQIFAAGGSGGMEHTMSKTMLFTSESVTEGHPDKMADQISDAILDAILAKDPQGRVACETLVTTGQVHVVGEISTSCYIDIPHIIRKTVEKIGYTRAKYGFDAATCGILVSLDEQSADIALGVDKALEAKEGESDVADSIGADCYGKDAMSTVRYADELVAAGLL